MRYGLNEEAYQQCLRGLKNKCNKSYRELVTQALETSGKWLQDWSEVSQYRQRQLLNGIAGELKIWV